MKKKLIILSISIGLISNIILAESLKDKLNRLSKKAKEKASIATDEIRGMASEIGKSIRSFTSKAACATLDKHLTDTEKEICNLFCQVSDNPVVLPVLKATPDALFGSIKKKIGRACYCPCTLNNTIDENSDLAKWLLKWKFES